MLLQVKQLPGPSQLNASILVLWLDATEHNPVQGRMYKVMGVSTELPGLGTALMAPFR